MTRLQWEGYRIEAFRIEAFALKHWMRSSRRVYKYITSAQLYSQQQGHRIAPGDSIPPLHNLLPQPTQFDHESHDDPSELLHMSERELRRDVQPVRAGVDVGVVVLKGAFDNES